MLLPASYRSLGSFQLYLVMFGEENDMALTNTTDNPSVRVVEVSPGDLPVCCPGHAIPLWQSHPRVYLSFDGGEKEAVCYYCSTRYVLR